MGRAHTINVVFHTHVPIMPKEFIDMVLDCVGKDVPSLKSCSLVSREWLYPARRRLFQTLRVMSRHDTRSFDAFLVLLNYAQGVCVSVRELHLIGFDTHSHSGAISHYLLRTILDKLPSLQTLSIDRCYWSPSTEYSGHALKSLRKLSIRTLFLFDFIHFVDILSLFSNIEELDVCDIKWTESFALSTPAEIPPHDIKQYVTRLSPGFRVGELCIENTENFMAFLWCLKELPFMRSLTTLNIRKLFPDPLDTHPEGVEYFAELLRDTGPTLLNCKIRLPQMYGYWEMNTAPIDALAALDLSHCAILHSIELNVTVCGGLNGIRGPRYPPIVQYKKTPWYAVTILLSLAPTTIQHITLVLNMYGEDEGLYKQLVLAPDWQELERTFLRFPKLRTVTILQESHHPNGSSLNTERQELFSMRLPSLQEKGALHFVPEENQCPGVSRTLIPSEKQCSGVSRTLIPSDIQR